MNYLHVFLSELIFCYYDSFFFCYYDFFLTITFFCKRSRKKKNIFDMSSFFDGVVQQQVVKPKEQYRPKRLYAIETEKKCYKCECMFKEVYELGRLRCVYHKLRWDSDVNMYPCCGDTNYSSKGCVRSDHMENDGVEWYILDNVELSLIHKSYQLPNFDKEAIVHHEDKDGKKTQYCQIGKNKYCCIRRVTTLPVKYVMEKFAKFVKAESECQSGIST